jgi:hypothetical protein
MRTCGQSNERKKPCQGAAKRPFLFTKGTTHSHDFPRLFANLKIMLRDRLTKTPKNGSFRHPFNANAERYIAL